MLSTGLLRLLEPSNKKSFLGLDGAAHCADDEDTHVEQGPRKPAASFQAAAMAGRESRCAEAAGG